MDRIMNIEHICQTMSALAGSDSFPQDDREWWVAYFCDPVLVERLIVHIAQSYLSTDEDMCKLLDMVEGHIQRVKERENECV
jgi:glycerol-3-phosphate dehydrogenase